MFTHEEEKQIREAEKRDRYRDKLRQSKRWKAGEEAKELVAKSIKIGDARKNEDSRKLKVAGRDDSMNTFIKLLHEDKSISRFVL